jgi:type IV secretory pathway TraG/TraD family ATPase VirD4
MKRASQNLQVANWLSDKPAIRPKIRSGPVNRTMFMAVSAGALAWVLFQRDLGWEAALIGGFCALVSLSSAISGIGMVVRDVRLRRNLSKAAGITDNYGTAQPASAVDIDQAGLRDPMRGDLLGLDEAGKAVFSPEKAPFGLFEMPPGVGKTVCYVIPSILNRAMRGQSVLVTDVKNDLAYMLAPQLRALGFEVWCINPTGAHPTRCGNVELHPYQGLLDSVFADDDRRRDAVKIANDYATLHYPKGADTKNPYFEFGSRRAGSFVTLMLALTDPGRVTPTDVVHAMSDPDRMNGLLRDAAYKLEPLYSDDGLANHLKNEARNLIHRAKVNEENFGSFLEGYTQRLISFSSAGRLGYLGRNAVKSIEEMRERQIIAFVMTPPGHLREFSDFISLVNHNLLAACKDHPAGHPVHIVGEEALNYRFNDLTSSLELMRQLRLTADFYIQSFSGLVKQHGREVAEAIESYSDVRVYAGLNSYARAKYVSDLLSEATLKKQDYSLRSEISDLAFSDGEIGRPLMKTNEVLAMPRDRAWVFLRGLRPVYARMLHYGQVAPWCDWVGESPITNDRLPRAPIINIDYSRRTKGGAP